jgi:hypothetical protein
MPKYPSRKASTVLNPGTVRVLAIERQTAWPVGAIAAAWPAWSGDGNRCRSTVAEHRASAE